jgi:hypothetical protein
MPFDPGFGKKCMHLYNEAVAKFHALHQEYGQVYALPKELLMPIVLWRFFREHEDNVFAVLDTVSFFIYFIIIIFLN